jgi:hypothetical protein
MGALKKHNKAKATTPDINIFTLFICNPLPLTEVKHYPLLPLGLPNVAS